MYYFPLLLLIKKYYFQMITDNFNISLIKVIFLMIYIFLVLTQLYVYCYAAETLLTEVNQLHRPYLFKIKV